MVESNLNKQTYELSISFPEGKLAVKDAIRVWLQARGELEFVDGSVDGLDLDFEYDGTCSTFAYAEAGGDLSPLILYKYCHATLRELETGIHKDFGASVKTSLKSMDSQIWQEGWKESFKPIETDTFLVCPPWDSPEPKAGLIKIEIDPGMAFGTGQHETTQLCLAGLSQYISANKKSLPSKSVLDVGTGSGILAIAAVKGGFGLVVGSDIDPDAVISAKENADRNSVSFEIVQGTVVGHEGFNLVLANILGVVIRKIFLDLARVVLPGGDLMLSGILKEEVAEFGQIGSGFGFKPIATKIDAGWALLWLRKHP